MGRTLLVKSDDLATQFRESLNLLHDRHIAVRPGTKLLTRYAVIVVDDQVVDESLTLLRGANFNVVKDSP